MKKVLIVGVVVAGVVQEGFCNVKVTLRHLMDRLQVRLNLGHFLEQLQAELTEKTSVDLKWIWN